MSARSRANVDYPLVQRSAVKHHDAGPLSIPKVRSTFPQEVSSERRETMVATSNRLPVFNVNGMSGGDCPCGSAPLGRWTHSPTRCDVAESLPRRKRGEVPMTFRVYFDRTAPHAARLLRRDPALEAALRVNGFRIPALDEDQDRR